MWNGQECDESDVEYIRFRTGESYGCRRRTELDWLLSRLSSWIQNTLTRPDISFDLSAPNDMDVQNQLATFSQEERTRPSVESIDL